MDKLNVLERVNVAVNELYGSRIMFYRETGFNSSAYRRLMNGQTPTPETAMALHRLLDVPELENLYNFENWNKELESHIQNQKMSITSWAQQHELKPDTVAGWVNGNVKNPYMIKKSLRSRAFNATGLRYFAPISELTSPNQDIVIEEDAISISTNPRENYPTGDPQADMDALRNQAVVLSQMLDGVRPSSEAWEEYISDRETTSEQRASNVVNITHALLRELSYYMQHPEELDELRRIMDPHDGGKLYAMINATFTEETWKEFMQSGTFTVGRTKRRNGG